MKKRIISVLLTFALILTAGVMFACTATETKHETYTVMFDYNYEGGPEAVTQSVKAGEKAQKPADPTRSGFKFGGWYLYGAAYDFSAEVNADITVEAYWRDAAEVVTPSATTYPIEFTETEGVSYNYGGSKPTQVEKDSIVRFAINVSPYYVVDADVVEAERLPDEELSPEDFHLPVVKANGIKLKADEDGAYSFIASERTTVTVTGIERDYSRMSGQGTEKAPYVISSPVQWVEFARKANNYPAYNSLYYKLGADLDFKGTIIPMVEEFTGVFEGNGKKLSDFVIDYRKESSGQFDISTVGLFGYLGGATVVDLTLEDFKVYATSNDVVWLGGLVGVSDTSSIVGCDVSGEINYTNTYGYPFSVGGLVGNLFSTSSGRASIVEYCNVDITVTGDGTGSVGGLIGSVSGAGALGPAFAANCSVTGTLTGGRVGGIVGETGPYSSVADCYFRGTVAADTSSYVSVEAVAGGIAGVMHEYESAISNCFAAATVSAVANRENRQFAGRIYGMYSVDFIAGLADVQAPVYSAPSFIGNTYYAERNTFLRIDHDGDGESYDIKTKQKLIELMNWKAAGWSGNGIYLTADSDGFSTEDYDVVVDFQGESFKYGDDVLENSYTVTGDNALSGYSPVSWTLGTDAIATFTSADENKLHMSTGFYTDAEKSHRLPAAYLLTASDDTTATRVYLGFSDYSEAVGETFYLRSGDYTCEITLGVGEYFHRARFSQGARILIASYLYLGDGELMFTYAPADISMGAAYAQIDFEAGTMDIVGVNADGKLTLMTAYNLNEYVGVWYDDNAEYKFDFDMTGERTTINGTEKFTYTVDGDTVSVKLSEITTVTLNKSGNALVGAGANLTREDKFLGSYETDIYMGKSVTFDGRGTDYTVSGGVATKGGVQYSFNDDGFLCTGSGDDEIIYGIAGGMAGMWTDTEANYVLVLTGVSTLGYGSAVDSLGNSMTYELDEDGMLWFSVSGVYCGVAEMKNTEDGKRIEFIITDGTDEVEYKLRLDDPFRGTWYSEEGKSDASKRVTLSFGKATTGGQTVDYTYGEDGNSVEFTVGSVDYKVEYVDAYTVKINNVEYRKYDAFAANGVMKADGRTEMVFNGLGEIGGGKVSIATSDNPTGVSLDYTAEGNVATVKNATGSNWLKVEFIPSTGLYEVTDLTVSGAEPEIYGVSNAFTGEWAANGAWTSDGNIAFRFSIGVLNAEFEGKATVVRAQINPEDGTSNGHTITLDYDLIYDEEAGTITLSDDANNAEPYVIRNSTSGLVIDFNDSQDVDIFGTRMPIAYADELAGKVWTSEDGSARILFDGTGLYGSNYPGTCLYVAGYVMRIYYYTVSSSGIPVLLANIGGSLYQYYVFGIATKANYEETAEDLAILNPTVFADEGKENYLFLICSMADELEGLTYVNGAGEEYSFIGGSIYYDSQIGIIGFSYFTMKVGATTSVFAYQAAEYSQNKYVIEAFNVSSFGRNGNYLPTYTVVVTVDDDGEVVSVEYDPFDADSLYEDLYAA